MRCIKKRRTSVADQTYGDAQVTQALNPTRLEIFNDSHKRKPLAHRHGGTTHLTYTYTNTYPDAHHKPMQGSTSSETHFRLVITSDAFKSKMQPARHRLVYGLLRDEMAAEGGIHALQLRTMTPEEEERQEA